MNLDMIVNEMQAKAGAAAALGKSLKIDFGNDECVHIDGTSGSNVVSGENKPADCTVKITKENLKALAEGELSPMMAMMGGKIKIEGDMTVAMSLQSLLG